jgi:thioredoxin-dependent peroxiredoxin
LPQFGEVPVFGVSADPVSSHRKFADKHELNFTLLADSSHSLCEAAGVWVEKSNYGKTYWGVERTTFVLDADGRVSRVFRKVKAEGHAADVCAFVNL